MKLSFPNPSRSFDETRKCVCFWGYDSSIEVAFYLDVGALQKLDRRTTDLEADCLEAFDTAAKQIQEVASKVHRKSGGAVYSHNLSEDDF